MELIPEILVCWCPQIQSVLKFLNSGLFLKIHTVPIYFRTEPSSLSRAPDTLWVRGGPSTGSLREAGVPFVRPAQRQGERCKVTRAFLGDVSAPRSSNTRHSPRLLNPRVRVTGAVSREHWAWGSALARQTRLDLRLCSSEPG